jgi:hypothetical protein
MGGGSYDRDVGHSSSSGRFSSGGTSSASARAAMGRSSPVKDTTATRTIESKTESPIVIGLDVTGSNTEFANIVYDKAPMLYGQIEQQGYLKNFDICFSAIGDAHCDNSPIQVCDFKAGIDIDKELKKLYMEGGGGGQTMETYELSAYYFAHKCNMPNATLPFFFFIADESPYAVLDQDIIEEYIGDSVTEDVDSKQIFRDLFRNFKGNVYIFQNDYGGSEHGSKSETSKINNEWKRLIGKNYAEHLIRIKEEKSIIDLILGTIAMVSGSRSLTTYKTDMVARGQTDTRIATVEESLGSISKAIVPRSSFSTSIFTVDSDTDKKKPTSRKF